MPGCGPTDREVTASSGDSGALASSGEGSLSASESTVGGDSSSGESVTPDPPEPDAVCGYSSKATFSFTPATFEEALGFIGAECDAVGGGRSDDGGASFIAPETSTGGAGTGDSSGTGSSPTWDELPVPCTSLCEALLCNEANDQEGTWLEGVTCELGDPDELDVRVMTCCYSIGQTGGRGHACIASRSESTAADETLRWLEALAHSEAASVHAFTALEQELASAGVPAPLLTRVRSAAKDEVRHAAMIGRLARRMGGAPSPTCTRTIPERDLAAIAIENAIEGCIAETVAAMCALHQGATASDPRIRAVMHRIGLDELEHAALAWDLHDWLVERLSAADRLRARRRASATIRSALESFAPPTRPDTAKALGLPDGAAYDRILGTLAADLWRREGWLEASAA